MEGQITQVDRRGNDCCDFRVGSGMVHVGVASIELSRYMGCGIDGVIKFWAYNIDCRCMHLSWTFSYCKSWESHETERVGVHVSRVGEMTSLGIILRLSGNRAGLLDRL
jgi:hypothetical protein